MPDETTHEETPLDPTPETPEVETEATPEPVAATPAPAATPAEPAPSEPADALQGFDQFDDPQTAPATAATPAARPSTPPPARQPAPVTDEDPELAEIERAVNEADETLGVDGKIAAPLKKLIERDRRREAELRDLQAQSQQSRAEQAWQTFEQKLGIPDSPPEVRKVLNRTALQTRFNKHFNAALQSGCSEDEARGEARATLSAEVKQLQKQQTRKPTPRVATNSAGSRLTPPGGATARTPKPRISPEDAFDNGDWALPK